MSATLVATGLGAGHGARSLFSGLDLVVAPGDVLGLVGANGAGKSTLLRLLAGLATPEAGRLTLDPPDAVVGYVAQETEPARDPATGDAESVLGHLARRTGVAAAERALAAATESLAAGAPRADEAYASALERWLALGGADLAERAPQTLADLGLAAGGREGAGQLLARSTAELSGGQAARVRLAAVLLSRFDIVLLDEPTNDLDHDGLARLERFVQQLRGGCVVVSHDREFLARCVTGVVELDLAQQQVTVYGGSYDAYLAERATARRRARAAYEEYAETRAGLEARARTQRGWGEAGARRALRRRPDNDKTLARRRAETSEKTAAKARQTERLIERLEAVEEPRKEWELRYAVAAAPRGSAVVATLSGAVARRGEFTLGPVSLQLDAGDRVGVTGPNGAGKSTLLAALLGRLPLASGSRSLGAAVAIGEVDQARRQLAGEPGGGPTTLLDAVRAQLPGETPADVRTLLAKFGLGADHVLRGLPSLSPGERTRAALAVLQARGVNLLVLDEPTNHLDLPAIEQLESALAAYSGTLLLVTHDRRLLEAVELSRRWHVEAGRVRED